MSKRPRRRNVEAAVFVFWWSFLRDSFSGEETTLALTHSLRTESLNGIDATGFECWNQRRQKGYAEKDAGGSNEH
jgi:hypothetical protein